MKRSLFICGKYLLNLLLIQTEANSSAVLARVSFTLLIIYHANEILTISIKAPLISYGPRDNCVNLFSECASLCRMLRYLFLPAMFMACIIIKWIR